METRVLIWSYPKPNAINPPPQWCFWWNLIMIGRLVSEIFMFESVDAHKDRRTGGRTHRQTPAQVPYYKLTLSLWLWWAKKYSSHTPRGSHQRLLHFQRKDKNVKDFIILNQVVAEKILMKNDNTCYMGVIEGKIENLKKEGKMRISILIFIYTIHFAYLKVYT